MDNNTTIFNNKFDSANITPQRLCDFATDTKTKLANNGNAAFAPIITAIGTAATSLQNEINGIDTNLNLQKGATLNADTVFENFKKSMSSEEPFVARALGGNTTAAYIEFYPHKLSEYGNATKEDMITLTTRVFTAATAHSAALGAALTATLTGYKASWASVQGTQQAKVNTVDAARNTRSTKRIALEQALTQAIGMAMVVYPTNPDSCKTLFDFTLLYPVHHQHIYNETIAGNAIVTVVKHKFGATAQIKVTTTTDTKVLVYLSTAKDATDSTAIDVAGNSSRTIDSIEFEVNLDTHRFVVIQNTESITTAEVKVEI